MRSKTPLTHKIVTEHIALAQDQIGAIITPIIKRLLREYNERPNVTEIDCVDANVHHVFYPETKIEHIYFGKAPNKVTVAAIKPFTFEMIDGRMWVIIKVKTFC